MKENCIHHGHHGQRHYMRNYHDMVAPAERAADVAHTHHMNDPRIPDSIMHPNYPPFHSNGINWSDMGLYDYEKEERFINRHDCGHHSCDNSMEPLDWDEIYTPGVPGDEIGHRYEHPMKPVEDKINMQDISENTVDDWFDDDDN